MSTKFEILSVAEDNWESDRISAKAESYYPNRQTLKLTFTSKGNLIIEASCPTNISTKTTQILTFDVDLDSLLQFVQEAKVYIEEEKVIEKLIGK
jgi:hypothetical protein